MLLIKENLDIWYRAYKAQYDRTTKYIKSRKGKMRDTDGPMTRKEFEIDFRSMVFDHPKKSGKQLAEMMAKQELYTRSYAQAKKYAEAHVAAFGDEVNINLIQQYRMQSREDVFTTIKRVRRRMRDDGFDSGAITILIGQEFFGSE